MYIYELAAIFMKTLPFIFLVFLFAYKTKQTKQQKENSISVKNPVKYNSLKDSFSYSSVISKLQKSPTPNSFFNNDSWKQYESIGHPDTALALFAYRTIKQVDTSFNDNESHIRLYKENKKVKQLLLIIFKSDSSINSVLEKIDTLNTRFRVFAEREVKKEIKKSGAASEPLGEFVESFKGKYSDQTKF